MWVRVSVWTFEFLFWKKKRNKTINLPPSLYLEHSTAALKKMKLYYDDDVMMMIAIIICMYMKRSKNTKWYMRIRLFTHIQFRIGDHISFIKHSDTQFVCVPASLIHSFSYPISIHSSCQLVCQFRSSIIWFNNVLIHFIKRFSF